VYDESLGIVSPSDVERNGSSAPRQGFASPRSSGILNAETGAQEPAWDLENAMNTRPWVLCLMIGCWPVPCSLETPMPAPDKVTVAIVKMPYVGERNVPELSRAPDDLVAGGLVASLEQLGARVKEVATVRLAKDQEGAYGAWNRLALANGHLADIVATDVREGRLAIGLLANCSSLLGMLGGVQRSGPAGHPLRVGLVYVDAHGDFNTPETTLSGMLGGMDVAAAAGLCLTNLRRTSKLEVPVPSRDIVLAGVRDTDPLEQQLIEREKVAILTVADLRQRSDRFRRYLAALSARVDRVYVHVDMDVLDPREVSGHSLAVPNGPSSAELAAAVAELFRDAKAAAIGIASTPTGDRDEDGLSRKAAYVLIRAAVTGAQQRSKPE
jgi:arginase